MKHKQVNVYVRVDEEIADIVRYINAKYCHEIVTNLNNKMDEMTPQEYIKANTLLREMFDDNSIR